MSGTPPFGSDRLVNLDNWQLAPWNRWGFQHVRELVPTAKIKGAGQSAWALPRVDRDVLRAEFVFNGMRSTVERHLKETQTDGFLVIHRGRIVAEHYFNAMEPDTPHVLMSVSKSITAAVCGIVVEHGLLDVGARLTDLIPELHGTALSTATTRHLLDMRAGVLFDENYDNPRADVRIYEQVYLMRPRTDLDLPIDATAYFATLRPDGEHGGPFRYNSILTDVLAWVLERATGIRFHELVSKELWQPMGAEFDAEVTLDACGNAMADGGISVTLRDLGRFGMQYLTPHSSDRRHAVPEQWVVDTVRGAPDGPAAFRAWYDEPGFPPGSHYRNCWWVRDSDAPYMHGSGIYGQNVFVHGPSETVVVKLSSWPTPLNREALEATSAAVLALVETLEK